MHALLQDIGIALIVATVVGLIFNWLKQPLLVSYLLTGIIIGPEMGPHLVQDPHNIEIISEIGLVLLLFIIGLEIELKTLMRSGKMLMITGLGQFIFSCILGVLFFSIAGFGSISDTSVFYLAIFGSLSSTAIVIKSLYDKFELDTIPGRISLGVLVLQDIWAILILVIQPSLSNPEILPILTAIAKSILLLTFGFIFSRYVLKHIFDKISKNPELVLASALGWAAIMAALAAYLGLSKEMGALIAGVVISTFPYSVHVISRVVPLRDVFLTLFFVSLGMQIPVPEASLFLPVALLILFVIFSRFLVVYPLVRAAGGSDRSGFISSLNLTQVSEFSLVIASFGLSYQHITGFHLSIALYSMAITAIISSYSIKFSQPIFNLYRKINPSGFGDIKARKNESDQKEAERTIYILGFHRGAQAMIDFLGQWSPETLEKMVVVDYNQEILKELQYKKVHGIFGDLSNSAAMHHIGLEKASLILMSIPDHLLKGINNLALVKTCREIAPAAKIISVGENRNHQINLKKAGADTVIMPNHYMGELLAKIITRIEVGLE